MCIGFDIFVICSCLYLPFEFQTHLYGGFAFFILVWGRIRVEGICSCEYLPFEFDTHLYGGFTILILVLRRIRLKGICKRLISQWCINSVWMARLCVNLVVKCLRYSMWSFDSFKRLGRVPAHWGLRC
jgi:hypothetical protein